MAWFEWWQMLSMKADSGECIRESRSSRTLQWWIHLSANPPPKLFFQLLFFFQMHWDSDLMYSSSYSKLATWLTCGGLLPPVCVTAPLHRVSSALSPSPPGCAWVSPSPPAPASSSALRRGAAPSASPGPHTPARSPCGSSPWTDSRDEKKELHLIWFDLFGYILVIMSTLVTCFRHIELFM